MNSAFGLRIVSALVMLAAPWLAAAPASQAQTCFGKPATVVGTPGKDYFDDLGRGRDVVVLLGGSDFVRGGEGNDRICGGPGRDDLDGGPGADRLSGGPGADDIAGDVLGAFDARGAAPDVILGRTGSDFLVGDSVADGGGESASAVGSADDHLAGGAGDDRIFGDNYVFLSDDTEGQIGFASGIGSDEISGGAGEDLLYGDHFSQAPGPDLRRGGPDRVDAGPDRDRIFAGPGRDRCDGGSGADVDGGPGGYGGEQLFVACERRNAVP